jgi:hypothetical protein
MISVEERLDDPAKRLLRRRRIPCIDCRDVNREHSTQRFRSGLFGRSRKIVVCRDRGHFVERFLVSIR